MRIVICTSGRTKIYGIDPRCELLIKLYDTSLASKVEENYYGYDFVTVMATDSNIRFKNSNWKLSLVSFTEPVINQGNFARKIDFKNFNINQLNDRCLNGKVMIAHNGDFYPCFQSKKI